MRTRCVLLILGCLLAAVVCSAYPQHEQRDGNNQKALNAPVVVEVGVEKRVQVEEVVDDKDTATEEEIQEETCLKLRKVQGKVMYVNRKTGLAVISLGRKIQIEYKNASGKKVRDSVKLPLKGILTAASSANSAMAHITGKLQICEIKDDKAFANVLPMPGNLYPSVGDVVYFTSRDIDVMRMSGIVMDKAEERTKNAASKATAEEAAAAEEVADLIGAEEEAEAPAPKAPARKETKKKANEEEIKKAKEEEVKEANEEEVKKAKEEEAEDERTIRSSDPLRKELNR